MTFSIRSLSFLLLLPLPSFAQPKAQPCFFWEDFENDEIPAGWDVGLWVERTTEDGEPLGEEVPAWRMGNAAQANAGGFFEVPNMPVGNRFIMANDDAPPCPCDMGEVRLITPQLDFTGRTNVALEFRVFHDMGFGGGEAHVEASSNGTDWYLLHTIPPVEAQWQDQVVDMTGWNDPTVWIRFRWSDNGEWATGIAIDDVCLRERTANDLSVVRVFTGNDTISPFMTGDQSLQYTQLPLEQAGPITVGAEVMNRGTSTLTNISISATIDLGGVEHGPFSGGNIDELQPGERGTIMIPTEWIPTTTGQAIVTVTATSGEEDEDPTDNSGITSLQITGPGWDDGYSAMALNEGEIQGVLGSSGIYIAGCRFELVNTGTPMGVSAVIASGSQIGAEVRAILFDANLAVLDTSERHTITQEDIELGWGGGAIYLPFSTPLERPAGDLFAGFQQVTNAAPVVLGVSGNAKLGSAFLMEGTLFELSYPEVLPMVRLHFAEIPVGVTELESADAHLSLFPNPVNGSGNLQIDLNRPALVSIGVIDMMGRTVIHLPATNVPAGPHTISIDLTALPAGMYSMQVQAGSDRWALPLIKAEN